MLIKVKTYPNSKKRFIREKSENEFEVYVKEKAEGGKANSDVILTISKYMNISPLQIKIIKGGKSRNKTLEIKEE